ncbi:c-type cytochrome [Actimicrobium antarcticum]|uniref:C-type cytochrome n=1 Tax=Actimicrobium antarcticum TaxID=1051899 RepID=A0ABP7TTC7_9BURK
MLALSSQAALAAAPTLEDSIAQRAVACIACHNIDGKRGADGYYPRIAGKPAGYLANQLINFREGRRAYPQMIYMVDNLSDDYLHELAGYFSALEVSYPPPPLAVSAAVAARGQALVQHGDAAKNIPACIACHGSALTGLAPAIPGLLGLPRDYIAAQFGAWRNGTRRAAAPDCMGKIAQQLSTDDVGALAAWLSAQPVPAHAKPATSLPAPLPLDCGSVPH